MVSETFQVSIFLRFIAMLENTLLNRLMQIY